MKTTNSLLYLVFMYGTVGLQHLKSGRECTADSECVKNAYCYEGKLCLCRDSFIEISTSKKTFICVNELSNLGDVCQYDIQCGKALGTDAVCKRSAGDAAGQLAGRCACKQDSHYQDGICYKNSRIGESCQVSDNCVILTPNLVAYCDQSRCICPPYYHPNDNGTDCLPSSGLNGPCLSDDDCITMNARCINVCACKVGYVINRRKTDCLIAADKLHAACDEDEQCTEFLPRTTCDPIHKRCTCSVGTHEVNGACFKSSGLHEPCTRKEECLIVSRNITRVECDAGFCVCSNDYEIVNRTDCIDPRRTIPGKTAGNNSMMLQINMWLLLLTGVFIPLL